MNRKRLLIGLSAFLSLLIVPYVVQAATITACTFDKDTYYPGQTGHITVTIQNYKEDKIRITELTATINYYYTDGNAYVQSFYTSKTLPTEIQSGQSDTFDIPFSLPTNIAPGYTALYVKAYTEQWNPPSEGWMGSDHPTYHPILHVESPYKEQLEEQVTINDQLEEQLEEQLTVNKNTTNMMYLFGGTAIVFVAVTVFLFILYRRSRFIGQPIA